MRSILLGGVLTATLMFPCVAMAHDGGTAKHKNWYLRHKVIRLYHDKEAPGCNLFWGWCKAHPNPGHKRIHRYFEVMRRMIISKQAASLLRTGRPYIAPANTRTASAPAGGTLESIAQCESGGNPSTNTGNGFYGKYQFDLQTWQSVGGSGLPSSASESEQDKRAAILYSQRGASPWPVCAAGK